MLLTALTVSTAKWTTLIRKEVSKRLTAIERLLSAPASVTAACTPKQPKEEQQQPQPPTRIFPPDSVSLYRRIEYDSLNPVDHLRSFVAFLRAVQSRYDDNYRIVGECDLQGQDILHKAEMGDDLDVKRGFKLYKIIREVRRKRRACKNENDLLRPICAYLEKHPDLISQLERLQGEVAQSQSAIDNRRYTMRTDLFEQEEAHG